MFFMVREGFEYTIAVYFYAFLPAFCRILHCILQHFALRLAPKRTAFSTKTHCVLRHIALHLAPKRTTFCCKWPKMGANVGSFGIIIHFAAFTVYPLLASKQTSARIDFLRQGGRLVDKMGSFSVKFFAEKWTRYGSVSWQANGHLA